MSEDIGLDFVSATVLSEQQQAFGVASTRQAIGFSFGGGEGFSIPGLSVHGHNNTPAPSGGAPAAKNNGPILA